MYYFLFQTVLLFPIYIIQKVIEIFWPRDVTDMCVLAHLAQNS